MFQRRAWRCTAVLLIAVPIFVAGGCSSRAASPPPPDAGTPMDALDGAIEDATNERDDGAFEDATNERDTRAGGWSPPTCLAALFASCRPEGACSMEAEETDAGRFSGWRRCYASGVRVVEGTCRGTGSLSETRVFKPDGTLCYTVARQWGPLCESSELTWIDATGAIVATGTYSGNDSISHRATCAATGETSEGLENNRGQPIVGDQTYDCSLAPCP